MRLSFSSLALLGLLPNLAHVFASDVLDLTQSTFSQEVLGEDLALVEFFAPCESSYASRVSIGSRVSSIPWIGDIWSSADA
jgi:hypothetical protein